MFGEVYFKDTLVLEGLDGRVSKISRFTLFLKCDINWNITQND